MRHWLFLSYARKNLTAAGRPGRYFDKFCSELKTLLEQKGQWEPGGAEQPMFFDRQSLQLMADWRSDLQGALQTSRVFACMVSPAYLTSEFCAKEFWLFDARRTAAAGSRRTAPVVLPIIWIPAGPLPRVIADAQGDHARLPAEYYEQGLLALLHHRRSTLYSRCLEALADAILAAGRAHPYIAPKDPVPPFETMPLAFEPTTSRARFAFVAAARSEFAGTERERRYSERGEDWRPFDPPVPHTVKEIGADIAYAQSMAYTEVAADQSLADSVRNARPRDRVVLVVDPWTLCLDHHRTRIPPRDVLEARRATVVVPFPDADQTTAAERAAIERALADAFPQPGTGGTAAYEQTDSVASFRAAVARGLATSHLTAIAAAADANPSTDQMPTISNGAANPNG